MNRFVAFLQKANPYHTINILKTKVDTLVSYLRPVTMSPRTSKNEPIPEYPYRQEELYDLSKGSDTLTIVQTTIRDEIFRNGVELLPGEDTDGETTTSEGEIGVDDQRKKTILEWVEKCNENYQSLLDVSKEMEDDLNIDDNGYGLFLMQYGYNDEGKIVDQKLLEFISASPMFMRPVMNKQFRYGFDDNGEEILFCPEHRYEEQVSKGKKCRCGKELLRAAFRHSNGQDHTYYSYEEVVHVMKYRPSKSLGYSPVMSVWQKVMTLYYQDTYMLDAYRDKRSPKQMIVFNTPNGDGLKSAWDDMIERGRQNPHQPAILGLEQGIGQDKKDAAQIFEFMRSLEEMQFSETRKELRTQIGAIYGVEPLFQGDISASGGLNNEGLQITVTNRAAERGQAIYNDKVYPRFLKALGVEGWVLKLREPEEQDEMAKLERQALTLQNGQLATQMGLKAEYDSDSMEVVIKDGPLSAPTMGFGMDSFGSESLTSPPNNEESPSEPKHTFNLNEEEPKHSFNSTDASKTPSGTPKHTFKSVEKRDATPKLRAPFTLLALSLKREIGKFLKIYKTKPEEKELRKAVDKMRNNLQEEMRRAVDRSMEQTYKGGIESVEKELGVNLTFGKVDEQTLMTLKNQPVLYESYAGLTNELVSKVNDVIAAAYHGDKAPTVKTITDALKNNVELADSRAENIARTETAKVQNAARRNAYLQDDPADDALYVWIGPEDSRTTETSKAIKKRVGNGKPWNELIKIIQEESAKSFPKWTVDKNFPVSHYQSRHTFLRVPR